MYTSIYRYTDLKNKSLTELKSINIEKIFMEIENDSNLKIIVEYINKEISLEQNQTSKNSCKIIVKINGEIIKHEPSGTLLFIEPIDDYFKKQNLIDSHMDIQVYIVENVVVETNKKRIGGSRKKVSSKNTLKFTTFIYGIKISGKDYNVKDIETERFSTNQDNEQVLVLQKKLPNALSSQAQTENNTSIETQYVEEYVEEYDEYEYQEEEVNKSDDDLLTQLKDELQTLRDKVQNNNDCSTRQSETIKQLELNKEYLTRQLSSYKQNENECKTEITNLNKKLNETMEKNNLIINIVAELLDAKLEDIKKFIHSNKTFAKENLLNFANNIIRKILNKPPNIPEYIHDFQIFLLETRRSFTKIFDKIIPGSPFSHIFQSILYGSNNNAGLKNAIDVIGLPEDRDRLKKILEVNTDEELLSVTKKDFFNKYMKPIIFPILDDIAKIHAYRNVDFNGIVIEKDYERDRIDVKHFDGLYKDIVNFLGEKYQIELITVKLFKTKLNDSIHDQFEFNESELTTLDFKYKELQNSLGKRIVYDLFSVGIKAKDFGFNQKPVVVFNL